MDKQNKGNSPLPGNLTPELHRLLDTLRQERGLSEEQLRAAINKMPGDTPADRALAYLVAERTPGLAEDQASYTGEPLDLALQAVRNMKKKPRH